MKVSAIIVAYKNSEVLVKCLDSIEKYNDLGDELEVIVVDNSPEDCRVGQALKQSDYKNYRYILDNNRGFGAGNNTGAKEAQGEILAFINPDIILIEPVFGKVYERFKENEKLALFGGKLLNENLSTGFSFFFDYRYSVLKKWTIKLWNKLDRFDEKTMFVSGANLFVRKNIFEAIGCFDENIFMYYEEADIIRRIKKLDKENKICFFKDIRMIHLEGKSTPSSMFSVKHEFESAEYFGKKYDLDYMKKITFEYRYYKLKRFIYTLLGSEKSKTMREITDYLKERYSL